MRALVIRRYGPPEVFEMQQKPEPQPKPGEVLIRVRAIGINFADLLQRMGLYPGAPKPPFVPGLEIAGVVEKAVPGGRPGDGEAFKRGDAVTAVTHFGAYAEWVSTAASGVYRLPAGMGFEDGAALPVNYLTAYHSMFTMGNLQPGNRILIHGAAGGVGIAAVQLARAKGLVIFGTAGPAKQEFLRKIGVDHPIDHEKSDFVQVVRNFAPDGIEMVMDPIGGKSLKRGQKCLGPAGRLVIYGLSDAAGSAGKRSVLRGLAALAQTPRFHPLKLMSQNLTVIGVSLGVMESRSALLRSELDELFRMYTAGKIKPVIAKTFPLDQAAAAHQYIHDRKNIGKVILSVK
ncbi:MAG TPA: zinc-binding dehydrogenase [Candidatus Acidoferrales bacterium]|nr:zinc-binding dehydrogenase [Candidatus Acidoferrales bacterium]